jgi:hypothetical protein
MVNGSTRKSGLGLTQEMFSYLLHCRSRFTRKELAAAFNERFGTDFDAESLHLAAFRINPPRGKADVPFQSGANPPPPLVKRRPVALQLAVA